MTQNTNLNISPYFDDFNEDKNYNKVLFKPGFPVQARELTTLQSILQNQIERFGQYVFKEGSPVIPGGTNYDNRYYAVRIDPTYLNLPVSAYTDVLSSNKIQIKGETTGVVATVVNRITAVESVDDFDTLYVKYTSSGTDGITKEFQDGENLITLSDIDFSSTKITANSSFANCIATGATKIGSSASISEGIYFIRGYFVKVPTETIILDQYTNEPSYKVGFNINEQILSASLENSDLYDNAQGFSNEAAPGADRFSMSVTLSKKLLSDNEDKNFVELIRVRDGVLEKYTDGTADLNLLGDALARRTYDESGDYYVRPFSVDVRESLNDRIGNRGLYLENQLTQNGNTPSDDIYCLNVSPGKAYVRGYEVKKGYTSAIDVVKPRTTKLRENETLPIKIGNVVTVNNLYGSPTIGYDKSDTEFVLLRSDRLSANRLSSTEPGGAVGVTVGKARVYDWVEKNVKGDAYEYEARLYDIQLHTRISVGIAITYADNDYFEGKYSGANGFTNGAGTLDWVSLQDVRGQFQINEPLLRNGVDIGCNVGVATDYSFEDVKSIERAVGVGGTFTADLDLNRKKKTFDSGFEFTISGGNTLACSGIPDLREFIKTGDIISYISTNADPQFNKVVSVTATSATIAAVPTVAGVCHGGVINTTPTGVDVVIPSIKETDNIGLRIPFANSYVSSVNVLDSSYIIRKQLSVTVASSGKATFNLSDTGDGNIYFEPFDIDKYVLTYDGMNTSNNGKGERVNLRPEQVNIIADAAGTAMRKCEINNLHSAENVTLTATLKRTKLTSKQKELSRCNNLIINRSKFDGSGSNAQTFNDGLTTSNIYGTRVQDKEISLNKADVHRVLAVFESSSSADPVLPTLIASDTSDVFNTNNVVVGEQFIGNRSGALGRVVSVNAADELSFVYENKKEFETSETITLKTSGIIGTISSLNPGDRNILDSYEVDSGHRPEFVDYGRIIRKKEVDEPTRKLRIIFDYFITDETQAGASVETINSYNTLDYSNEIPFVIDRRASDFIDLRARVKDYDTSSSNSPFSFDSRDFSNSTSDAVVTNETVVVDYSHYLGRIDRLYLTKDGIFEAKKGEPAISPKAPLPNDEALEVALIKMQPYLLNATGGANVTLIPHKRYTMSDIGGLEHRIKNLENYTTLSLLETDTKNLSIKDPNTGLDKFKSGFFVDNFRNHASHNFSGDSQFDIDLKTGECRPRTTERNVSLIFETKSSTLNPLGTDYRFTTDFDSDNITRNGPGLTLKFTNETFIDQPLATRVENLNPFQITIYSGTIELTPASDFWIDEIVADTPETINIGDGVFSAIAELMGVEDRENGGMSTGVFNSSEFTWGASELISEELVSSEVIASESDSEWRGNTRFTTTNETISNDFLRTMNQSGIQKDFGFELTSHTETVNLGPKVTGTDVLYNCRSRNIEVVGKRLKPNTKYYVFMENVDVTQYCVPKLIPITMDRGSFTASDIITNTGVQIALLGVPGITFRAAQANHKFGQFNNPSEVYATEPYNQTPLSSSYSGTSSVLNVDTFDLGDQRTVERSGWVVEGQRLANESGTAEATVGALSLMSDEFGNLIFSLHIPDPSNPSNPKFTTGLSTIRVTTSATNANILDPGEASAQTTYLSSGYAQYSTEQTLAIKTPEVERKQIGTDQPVTRITQELEEDRIEQRVTVEETGWRDPLAQSFIVPRDKYADGMFITGGELYFKAKDDSDVTVQIRELDETGRPSQTILPFGETKIISTNAGISTNGTVGTGFTFSTPVYVEGNGRYAITLITPTTGWNTFITRMNEPDLITGRLNDKQPTLGSLFKSQNGQLWSPSNQEDLKFKLFKAKFVTNAPASVVLYNNDIPTGKIRKENAVTAYSKRQYVSIANTVREFDQGNTITQGAVTGNIFEFGGPIDITNNVTNFVNTGLAVTFDRSTGIGLTPTSGTVDYAGVTFSSLNGNGTGAQAVVKVKNGAVDRITMSAGGKGYKVGDSLISGPIGFNGSQVRAVVGVVSMTNYLVVDDVEGSFTNSAYVHTNTAGANETMLAPLSVPSTDTIRDGSTLKFDHRNHGMHSSTNKVKVEGFSTDIPPVLLTTKIDDSSTTVKVPDAASFTTFEGDTVTASNPGYVQIGKEIIEYKNANTTSNELEQITRGVDSSLKSNHDVNEFVYKYEFSGVSLRKVNKTHDISNKEKTFNTYHVELSDTTKVFQKSKSGGGKNVSASQNIPFEAVTPKLNCITPTGTNIISRIKTTSGTSISGGEGSFVDKGYEPISLNKLNLLDTSRIVASETNEYELMSDKKSFGLELTLSSNNENVSPLIDLNTANVILHSNLVNKPIADGEWTSDSRPRIPGQDPHSGVYETKRIDLEFPSNSIYVQFDGNRMGDGEFRVFYKLYRSDGQDFQQTYLPFNGNGLPDKTVNANTSTRKYSEYKFTGENLPQFNGFMIKVIMTSSNQATPPRFKNFRSIALRSFDTE